MYAMLGNVLKRHDEALVADGWTAYSRQLGDRHGPSLWLTARVWLRFALIAARQRMSCSAA